MVIYSELIKGIRATLLVSQVELAEMLDVSFATVNRWENGHHEPTFKQKRKIRELCQKNGIEFDFGPLAHNAKNHEEGD